MNPTLMALLEIQDLRSKLRELDETPDIEVEEFHVDLAVARAQLEAKVDELVGQLEPRVRRRYEQVASHRERVVVPVLGGVCYGCFVSVASARVGEQAPNLALQTCESCGRFLYFLA